MSNTSTSDPIPVLSINHILLILCILIVFTIVYDINFVYELVYTIIYKIVSAIGYLFSPMNKPMVDKHNGGIFDYGE